MICETVKETKKRLNFNKIVHTLTNKASHFESGAFPDNNFFEPSSTQSEEWLKIQKYLMLDSLRTDYYLNFALGILEAHPDIRDLIKSKRETYDVFELPRLKSKIEGAVFSDNGIYYSKFLKYDYKFPIPEIYTLRFNSENRIEVFDGEKAYLKNCKIVTSYGDDSNPLALPQSYINFDWSDELPLKGVLAYTGQWEDGSNITIEFVPHSIDIKVMIESIEANNNVSSFLQESVLYESYLLARSGQEKLALLE
jgi:hypothetical protein